ncbi:MAG: NYN domain-containing protein [Actinomycetota bacterium]|nr:NYN domain-containing protein [Actinomycetota bacterium]
MPPPDRQSGREAAATVLVDARNVLRSTWPNMREQEVVDGCRTWAKANGTRAVVVFDGSAPGGMRGERAIDDHCVVVGTGSESADAWIERAAAELRAQGYAYWLVTSDRELRAAAGSAAERTIGGGTFARVLRSLQK